MKSYQNPNWTVQFQNLPDGWDTNPAIFNQVVEEHVFHCEGENCPITGRAVVNGGREDGLWFTKIVATKLATEADGVTPRRDTETGQKFFQHEDAWRRVFCFHHMRWAEGVAKQAMTALPEERRTRGDKVEAQSFTLFQNFSKLAEMSRKNKRSERVAKFFLALTEGAGLEAGIALDCIRPFDPAAPKDKKQHNFLVRGGEIIGLISRDDVRVYNGVRHQNKAAFIAANLYLYVEWTLDAVEESLSKWNKEANERAAVKAAREAAATERRREAADQQSAMVSSRDAAASELLGHILGNTSTSTEPQTAGGRKGERREGRQPKQRKSAPPPSAARQISEHMDAGERAIPSSDTPDVIVDDSAGGSNPTYAVTLEDRPEISEKLEAVRAQLK